MTESELLELKKQYPEKPIGRAKDLSKQIFGKLHPLYRTESPKRQNATYWVCKCDCGNIRSYDAASLTTGRSKSCGCIQRIDIKSQTDKNIIGTIINNWKIIKRDPNNLNSNHVKWIVECTCEKHTQKSMRIDEIKSSLGCPYCSTAQNKLIDLTNQKFGHWTVLSKGSIKGCHIMWLCECDCENHTQREVDGYALKTGKSTSCGCQHFSKGEEKIKQLLKNNNLSFETQKIFNTCKTSKNKYAKFDFYINNQYLIEFDGEQHFKLVSIGWNNPEKLARTKERDAIKNQWCKENNISLIRIPYTHLKKLSIDDLKLETSKFIV